MSRFRFASYSRLEGDGEAARRRSSTAAIGVRRSGEGREEEASWWPSWMRDEAAKVWHSYIALGWSDEQTAGVISPAMECPVNALNLSVLGE
jgi:hypothetical protein